MRSTLRAVPAKDSRPLFSSFFRLKWEHGGKWGPSFAGLYAFGPPLVLRTAFSTSAAGRTTMPIHIRLYGRLIIGLNEEAIG